MGWGEGRELNKESKLLGVKLKWSLKLRCSGTNFQFWLGNTSSIVLCLVTQSCSTLWEPMDSLSMGILQARILESVAMPSSRGSSRPRNRALVSRIASRFLKSEPPGKPNNTEVGSLSLRRGRWHPTPVLLPGEPHGRRSLVGCSPWCREESGTTDGLRFHFSLSCIGEGHGNPLQCSCLESPRDGGSLVGFHLWGRTESDTTGAT